MTEATCLTRNVGHWLDVLKVLSRQLVTVTVDAGRTLEIDDRFFEIGDPASPLEANWVQVPARNYDLLLEDGGGTIHLANLSGRVAYLQGQSLVTWYGYDQSRHEIVMVPADGEWARVREGCPPPEERLLWFAWDRSRWDTFVHDGSTLSTLSEREELSGGIEPGPYDNVWLGWDGQVLDVFDCKVSRLPAEFIAIFVGATGNVGGIRRRS